MCSGKSDDWASNPMFISSGPGLFLPPSTLVTKSGQKHIFTFK